MLRPDLTKLPIVIESLMKPWIDAVETTAIGMGPVLAGAAVNTSASLKRRVDLTPEADGALAEALSASDELARTLDRQVPAVQERKATLAALAVLIDALRASPPSASTRSLGLGW